MIIIYNKFQKSIITNMKIISNYYISKYINNNVELI